MSDSGDVNMNATVPADTEGKSDVITLLSGVNHHVSERWQVRCKFALRNLSRWCCYSTNFVGFAHFWLSQLKRAYKQNYLALQYDALSSELRLGFEHECGGDADSPTVLSLLRIVLPEYPRDLYDTNSHVFLHILHLLRLDETELHSDLFTSLQQRYSTKLTTSQLNLLKQVRSFCLVIFCSSMLGLYHKLSSGGSGTGTSGNYLSFETGDYDWPTDVDAIQSRRSGMPGNGDGTEAFQCLELEYSDVLEYMFSEGRAHMATCVDSETGETMIHRIVALDKLAMLKYLLVKLKELSSVDSSRGDSVINKRDVRGDTALHIACRHGDVDVVTQLVTMTTAPRIDINATNTQDDNATPLHVAARHGHAPVIKCLLYHGAEPKCRLSDGRTALDLMEAGEAGGGSSEPVLGTLRRRLKQLF